GEHPVALPRVDGAGGVRGGRHADRSEDAHPREEVPRGARVVRRGAPRAPEPAARTERVRGRGIGGKGGLSRRGRSELDVPPEEAARRYFVAGTMTLVRNPESYTSSAARTFPLPDTTQ